MGRNALLSRGGLRSKASRCRWASSSSPQRPARGTSVPARGAIENGTYSTPSGKGLVGGPHIVEIAGWDGVPITESGETLPEGTELFPLYHTRFDFPKDDGEHDFAVSPDTDISDELNQAAEESGDSSEPI